MLCQHIDTMVNMVNLVKSADRIPRHVEVAYHQDTQLPIASLDIAKRLSDFKSQTIRSIRKSWSPVTKSHLINDQHSVRIPTWPEISALGDFEKAIRSFKELVELELTALTTIRQAKNITSVREPLREAFERVNGDHFKLNNITIEHLLLSPLSTVIADRVRRTQHQSLHAWSMQMLSLQHKDHIRRFKQRVLKISTKSPVKTFLYTLVSKTIQDFSQFCDQLRTGKSSASFSFL